MLGDKVSNLLINLIEEELKDYEFLKQVVLREYEPSPKICLENFRKVKLYPNETFSQFAFRLTPGWLYYCKLSGANDFESVNQLIIADKMFEMLESDTVIHIGVLQGEEWYKPRDLGKQYDIFYSSKGKSYDRPARGKFLKKQKSLKLKKLTYFTCGSYKHFRRDCPKNKGVANKRLNVNKVSTEGTELEDGTVTARIDFLGKVIPRQAIEDKLSKLVKTSISVDGKLIHALVDSGTEITVVKKDLVPGILVEGASMIYLKEVLVEDVLLPPDVFKMLGGARGEENSLAQSSLYQGGDSGAVGETEVSWNSARESTRKR
ncbi:retrovirus-related Pol polyprotein from transposon opus [Nephila pilipes]|uniref:Retrovirus-related Pol polyprotein from transposon opus n=1 Tax=Nephila pilipes TaxID=299642 RepID=A0A8X6P739_NEPPI|nr:retrovirus-related Pol polyprotein from transposon opus [Nephila pilipes]